VENVNECNDLAFTPCVREVDIIHLRSFAPKKAIFLEDKLPWFVVDESSVGPETPKTE
jgi:hypothetical protein